MAHPRCHFYTSAIEAELLSPSFWVSVIVLYFILKLLETEIITRLTGLLFTVLIILESL